FTAYRDGRRLVRTFTPAPVPGETRSVRENGTYLITGGLGDAGLLVAEHLVRAGAGRLVLTSRSGATGGPREERVRRLRELGAGVLTPAVDVTDEAAMRAMLRETLGDGRLDGVVHAAADTGQDSFVPLRDLDAA